MRKKSLLISTLPVVPMLGSWKDVGTISVRLYSFMYYYILPDETTRHGNDLTGHSFLEFYNNTSNSVTVGYYPLPSKETVSVGLWGAGSDGGSSSGSSDGSSSVSSSGSSSTNKYDGVYYNREEYQYNCLQKMDNACQYEMTISKSKLSEITTLLKEKNDTYKLTTYNCSHLTTEIWNSIAGTSWYMVWLRKPRNVVADIKGTYPNYIESSEIDKSNWYAHYDTSSNSWSRFTA